MGHRTLRARVRMALKKALREGDGAHSEAIDMAMLNDHLADAVGEEALERASDRPFLDWLLEHYDEILAILLKLLPLFVSSKDEDGKSPV